ncbi:MAG: hypothetical protein GXO62_05230 [Epsilonproteobacteria bacterium]|nr:hypothetical protein [Campylobacterota bacterium]
MKVSVLKFRIADKIFAIEMPKVRHFFDVEEVLTLPYLPPFVKGIVRYNDYVYPLISVKKAWNLKEEDTNTAVAMEYNGKEYAILIDEVISIEELEKKSSFLVEVFEENGELIGNLNLDFLEYIEVPTFVNKKDESKKSGELEQESFLLFECGNELLAIRSSILRKAEEYEGGDTIILNNFVLPLIPFSKIYKESEKKNILVLEDEKILGVVAGEVIDVVLVDNDEIVKAEGMFDAYFIHNNRQVKVFNNEYLKTKIERFGVVGVEKEEKHLFDKEEVLIVDVLGEQFALRMKNIVEIDEYDKANLNFSVNNPFVKGIITTRFGSAFILSLERVFSRELKPDEDTKIIVLKDKILRALVVTSIEDLIYVDEDKIVLSDSEDTYIGGVVMEKERVIPLFNPDWPKGL